MTNTEIIIPTPGPWKKCRFYIVWVGKEGGYRAARKSGWTDGVFYCHLECGWLSVTHPETGTLIATARTREDAQARALKLYPKLVDALAKNPDTVSRRKAILQAAKVRKRKRNACAVQDHLQEAGVEDGTRPPHREAGADGLPNGG